MGWRSLSRLLPWSPLAVVVLLFVVTGFRGVDYGVHWDEEPLQLQPVRTMAASGILLPREYTYPSFSKWLILMPAWPSVIGAALSSGGDPDRMQAALKAGVEGRAHLLAAREIFIVVSALAIIWVYGAVYVLRRKHWLAFFAACGMGLTWEYAYHARYLANDCLLTQFMALMLLFLALFHTQRRTLWLYLAAVAVGLGIGAKQPAVFLLFPVFFSSIVACPPSSPGRHALRLAALAAIAFGAFVVTTPGVLLDPFTFIRDGRNISAIYGRGHGGFTTTGALNHWRLILTYLAVSYFSPFKVVALVMFACAALGGVIWVRRDWRFGVMLLAFPVTFLSFFCAKYVVMIARQYLPMTPLLCIMAARGLEEIVDRIDVSWGRRAVAAGLSVLAVAHAAWLVRAGESIRHIDPNEQVRQAVAYVATHASKRYRVSDKVRTLAREQNLALPGNVVAAPAGDAVVMFGRADMGSPDLYVENDPWLTEAVFGPLEVNFNWYAVWGGFDRVVVMPIEKARAGAVPLAQ